MSTLEQRIRERLEFAVHEADKIRREIDQAQVRLARVEGTANMLTEILSGESITKPVYESPGEALPPDAIPFAKVCDCPDVVEILKAPVTQSAVSLWRKNGVERGDGTKHKLPVYGPRHGQWVLREELRELLALLAKRRVLCGKAVKPVERIPRKPLEIRPPQPESADTLPAEPSHPAILPPASSIVGATPRKRGDLGPINPMRIAASDNTGTTED